MTQPLGGFQTHLDVHGRVFRYGHKSGRQHFLFRATHGMNGCQRGLSMTENNQPVGFYKAALDFLYDIFFRPRLCVCVRSRPLIKGKQTCHGIPPDGRL
jgi:hypothetical protein